MATSSIFADFSIHDPKTLKNFIDALEASRAEVERKETQADSTSPVRQLTDPAEIKDFLLK